MKSSTATFTVILVWLTLSSCWLIDDEQNRTTIHFELPDSTSSFLSNRRFEIIKTGAVRNSVEVHLSLNSASAWLNLSDSVIISEMHLSVPAPQTFTKEAVLKIVYLGDTLVSGPFTIGPLILTSPLNGQKIGLGEQVFINWATSDSTVNDIAIQYIPAESDLKPVDVVSRTMTTDSNGTGEYKWEVPHDWSSRRGRIFVKEYFGNSPYDYNAFDIYFISHSAK